MRIKSITARNYKIHREVIVELAPACTVIGGPNECGKSTLAEAAHRALFLKAKITGETQQSMVSFVPAGQPEVEVCFEAGDKTYRIFKRFSGQTGMARLSEIGGASWQDEAAEEQLAKILGVELAGGGRGAGDRAAQQWAHLWVRQGQAGDDPSEHANVQRDTLMSRLQLVGGAAVMQSELDARVATGFAQWFENIYNRNGNPKANSDLARAAQKEQDAVAQEAKARETFSRLQQAVSDHERAEATILTAERSLSILAPQKEEVEGKLKRVEGLRRDEEVQRVEAEAASTKHKEFSNADQRIQALRNDIQNRTREVQPKIAEATRLKVIADGKRRAAQTASAEYDAATEATRTARLQKDLAVAYEVLHEKTGQYKQLAETVRIPTHFGQ
jgi:DNA repair exonuclease SbcCD ATPase subunit